MNQKRKRSLLDNLSGIVSIISTAIICIRLAYFGIISIEWTALIMLSVVIMVAIGHTATRLGICAIAIYLFAKFVSQGNQEMFQSAIAAILALLIALIGLYIILRQIFGRL